MLHNSKACSLDAVEVKLRRSSSFAWSWSQENTEPYRHTAIVFVFDEIPKFTINFRPCKGANKCEAAFSECDSEVTVEPIVNPNDGKVVFHPPFEELELKSDVDKDRAWQLIRLILSYEPGKYNLLANNCRNHVDGVKKHVQEHRKNIDVSQYEDNMVQVKNGDFYRYAAAAASAFMAVAGVVIAAAGIASAALVGKKNDESDDEEDEEVFAAR